MMMISGDAAPNSGQWTAAGDIVRGAIHIRQDKPCQDALFLLSSSQVKRGITFTPCGETDSITKSHTDENIISSQSLIACVADGHGSNSCPYSDDGAAIAVKITAEILREMLPSLVAHKDIRLPKMIETKWKDAVRELHADKAREMIEPFPYILYGSTLLAIATGEDFVLALKIGDGNILMIDENNARPILADEESVGEDTESLCLDDAWTYVRTQIIPWNTTSPAMFMISTDGYAKSFADSAGFNKAGTDFYKLWREEGLAYVQENLSDWLRQSSDKGSGDDIAMALLCYDA